MKQLKILSRCFPMNNKITNNQLETPRQLSKTVTLAVAIKMFVSIQFKWFLIYLWPSHGVLRLTDEKKWSRGISGDSAEAEVK